jgi:glycosyltransferase involved in cell wall biosynthesis
LSELVQGGETGLLVPPEDDRAMAEAMLELLRDRERGRKMGEAGRASATLRFSLEKMKQAWIDLASSR